MIFEWIGVFFGTVLLDFVWTKYIERTANGTALAAALWAMPVVALGGVMAVAYVHNPVLILAATMGAFTGTYVTKRWL